MIYKLNQIRKISTMITVFSLITLTIFTDNIKRLGEYSISLLLLLTIISYICDRKFRLIYMWALGFIYVISSEMILESNTLEMQNYALESARYIIISCCLLISGYTITSSSLNFNNVRNLPNTEYSNYTFSILVALSFIFMVIAGQDALIAMASGRSAIELGSEASDAFINTFILSSGLLLPTLIQHFCTKASPPTFKKIILYFCVFIIAIIFLLMGTRFYLLFSLGGFFILLLRKFITGDNTKKIIKLLPFVLIFLYGINDIKDYRSNQHDSSQSTIDNNSNSAFSTKVAKIMSPEGVIKMNAYLMDYTDKNGFLYGASTAFVLYFWVPRAIWPDKPTMIGYWLIRNYEGGFSDKHSASLGFTGDLYADFGYGSYIVFILMGILLARIEKKIFLRILQDGKSIIISCMVFPLIFFFVRSPITATTSFISMFIFYFILSKFLIKNK